MNRLYVAGSNDVGQLGTGDEVDEYVRPTELAIPEVRMIAAGAIHNAAITSQGRVITWGCDDDKSLGRDTARDESLAYRPGYVPSLEGRRVILLDAGDCHTNFVSHGGEILSCGTYRNSEGKKRFGKDIVHQTWPDTLNGGMRARKVVCGNSHSMALLMDGSVYSWGVGDSGQLGRRVSRRKWDLYVDHPIALHIPSRSRVIDVICAGSSSFAITENGEAFAWGLNSWGNLGFPNDGDDQSVVFTPTPIEAFSGMHVVDIAGGDHHSIFIVKKDNDLFVYSAGRFHDGRLGRGEESEREEFPMEIKALRKKKTGSDVASVACGSSFSFAILKDGRAFAWGCNDCGQLGIGGSEDVNTPTLVSQCHSLTARSVKRKRGKESDTSEAVKSKKFTKEDFSGIAMISAGSQHTLFLRKE